MVGGRGGAERRAGRGPTTKFDDKLLPMVRRVIKAAVGSYRRDGNAIDARKAVGRNRSPVSLVWSLLKLLRQEAVARLCRQTMPGGHDFNIDWNRRPATRPS
jgi:hypothetical protein